MSISAATDPHVAAAFPAPEPRTEVASTGPGTGPGFGLGEDELHLAQLLCARLCHDLIGAAGAISNGVELLDDDSADLADIHDLLAVSGRHLNRRLALYRQVFALTASRGVASSLAEARRLATAYLEEGRVALHWRHSGPCCDSKDDTGAAIARVLLCAIMVAAEGMRRGGDLSVAVDMGAKQAALAVEGEGRGAELAPPVVAALDPQASASAISARTVPAYYLARLARRLGLRVEVVQCANRFTLRLLAARL